ncbi:MAG TPA: hypothetical protein PK812_12940, partial [Beijerinckiaceae bacterium]|nr:hypothetical protein [Beijerinckiaceae bacterium]
AGTRGGSRAPNIAAALLAVAALAGGCVPLSGDLGRPRPLLHASRLEGFAAPVTRVEQEREDRLVHFRRAAPPLPGRSASAAFNALRDHIETDRALLPPLRAALAGSADKQRIRAVALGVFPSVDTHARAESQARIVEDKVAAGEFCPLLRSRAQGHRAQLEALVVHAPEVEAIAAERSLVALESEIAQACVSAVEPGAVSPPMRIRK